MRTPKANKPTTATETWAYCRVSTQEQDITRQRHEILHYANANRMHITRFIESTVSSRKDINGRNLNVILNGAYQGEIKQVVFSELSRLGRSISELCRITDRLIDYGCTLHFIKEGLVLQSGKKDITTKVLLNTFSLLAEIERDLISERTKAGLAARKAQGVKLGRPEGTSKLNAKEDDIRKLYQLGVTQKAICKQVGCAQNTLSKFIKRRKNVWEE